MTVSTTETRELSAELTFQIPVQQFFGLLRSVIFACGPESSRYTLSGVRIEISKGELSAIATDSRRLAYQTVGGIDKDIEGGWTFDYKACREILKKATKSYRGDVTITVFGVGISRDGEIVEYDYSRSTRAVVEWDRGTRKNREMSLDVVLLEGRFPKWRDIIPYRYADTRDTGGILKGRSDVLLAAFDPAESRGWLFEMNGKVTASKPSINLSRVADFYHVDGTKRTHSDAKVEYYFDLSFLVDWLSSLPDSTPVEIQFIDANSPCHCTSDCGNYVFMPLNRDC